MARESLEGIGIMGVSHYIKTNSSFVDKSGFKDKFNCNPTSKPSIDPNGLGGNCESLIILELIQRTQAQAKMVGC